MQVHVVASLPPIFAILNEVRGLARRKMRP